YRDDYYYPQRAEDDGLKGFTEIITLKGRQTGAGRTALVRCIPGQTAWEDLPESEVQRYLQLRGREMRGWTNWTGRVHCRGRAQPWISPVRSSEPRDEVG